MPAVSKSLEDENIGELKTILRSLIISQGKIACTVQNLNRMYREEEGTPIRYWEYGFSSLVEFLSSLNDVCQVRYNRNGDQCVYHVSNEKSAHISEMVSRQRAPTKKRSASKRGRSNYSHRIHSYNYNYNSYKWPTPHARVHIVNSNFVLGVLTELRNISTQKSSGLRKIDVLSRIKSKTGNQAPMYTIQNLNVHLAELSHTVLVKDDYIYFKTDLASQRRTRPTENPNGHSLAPTTSYNNPINGIEPKSHLYNNFDYKNEPGLVPSEPSIVNGKLDSASCSEVNGQFNNQFSNHINGQFDDEIEDIKPKSRESSVINDVINERTKIRLQKLIEKHPEGIWCSELPDIYKKEYNIDLDYNESGFNNITEFVSTLTDIFLLVEPIPDTKRQMIVNAKNYDTNTSGNDSHKKTMAALYNYDDYIASDVEPVPIKLSPEVSSSLVPIGFMNVNETIDQVRVSTLISEEYIEIIVSEIFTPSFFWVKLRKNKKKFNALMNDLGDFYNRDTLDLDQYKVPQVILHTGLNIACIYANMWHRAIIKKIKPDGFVIVFFYDYGTVKTYNPNDLYFLHKRFSTLPAQAIACGLHYVKPVGSNEWPTASTNAFVNKVWDIPLVAYITSTNEENNTMMISMTDTSDDQIDLHINDWMVDNGLAERGKMENKIPLHKLCMYDEVELLKRRAEERYQSHWNHTHVNYKNVENTNNTNFENINSTNVANANGTNFENINNTSVNNSNNENIENALEQVDVKDYCTLSLTPSSTTEEPFIDTCNVASLVKKNIDLVKQTNTMVQAIVLSMPINKDSTEVNNNFDFKTGTTDGKIVENQNLNLERLNKNFTYDLDKDSSIININNNENHCQNYNDVDNSYCNEKSSTLNIHSNSFNSLSSTQNTTSTNGSAYTVINLSEKMMNKAIHVFHLGNEGWICASEFVNAFTNMKDQRVMFKLLEILEYDVRYKHITRDTEPQLFSQLDKSALKVPRYENKIKLEFVLTLLPLRDALQILVQLDFLNPEELRYAAPLVKNYKGSVENLLDERYNNKILFNVLNLVVQYNEFKRTLRQAG